MKSSKNTYSVVLCSWKRVDGVIAVLEDLGKQSFKDFSVHIVNNNKDTVEVLENVVLDFKKKLDITLTHNHNNLGGRARFLKAKQLSSDYCIFLDDDQLLGSRAIESLVNVSGTKKVCSWWGWFFEDNYAVRSRCAEGELAKYCGTGGMVIDRSLFDEDSFWSSWPEEFFMVEDLYLSWYAYNRGWVLSGHSEIPIHFNEKLFSDSNSLFKKPEISLKKQRLVEVLGYKNKKINFEVSTYWDNRYRSGGGSGAGSEGTYLEIKKKVILPIINELGIKNIEDFGCGEGSLIPYLPLDRYKGYDISPTIINKLKNKYGGSTKYEFNLINEACVGEPDMALSLDVFFHLVEDSVCDEYLQKIIGSRPKWILFLTWNSKVIYTEHIKGTHVRYRDLTRHMHCFDSYTLDRIIPHNHEIFSFYLYRGKQNGNK